MRTVRTLSLLAVFLATACAGAAVAPSRTPATERLTRLSYDFGADHSVGSWHHYDSYGDEAGVPDGGRLKLHLVGSDDGVIVGPRRPAGVEDLGSVDITTAVKRFQGEADTYFGIYCRASIDHPGTGLGHRGYFFYLNGDGSSTVLRQDGDDSRVVSNYRDGVVGTFYPSATNDVRAICREAGAGVDLELFLNDLQVLDAHDDDALPAGEVGVHAGSGAGPVTDFRLDYFTVNELGDEADLFRGKSEGIVVDDFSGGETAAFSAISDPDFTGERQNGVWHMAAPRRRRFEVLPVRSPRALAITDARAQVDVFHGTPDSVAGITCRQRQRNIHVFGGRQGYVFVVGANGYAAIAEQSSKGDLSFIQERQLRGVFRSGGVNTLTIECVDIPEKGSVSLLLAINGSVVLESEDPDGLPLGAIGLLVSGTERGPAEVNFDNYEISLVDNSVR